MNLLQPSVQPLLVPKSGEEKYCRQNKMVLSRHENNPVLLGIARGTTDSVWSSLNLAFPLPKVPDTPELFCTYHLLEHLINPPVRPNAEKQDVYLNASTYSYHIVEVTTGYLAPKPNKYSLWEITPQLLNRIGNLAKNFSGTANLEGERAAVKSEIVEDHAKQPWLVEQALAKIILADGNPIKSYYAVKENTIDTISEKTLKSKAAEAFTTDHLVGSVFYDGSLKTLENYLAAIKDGLTTNLLTRSNKTTPTFAQNDLINDPVPKPPLIATTLANNIISLCAYWLVNSQQYDPVGLALKILPPYLSEKFFIATRRLGWGYVAMANHLTLNQKHIIYFQVNLDKKFFYSQPSLYQKMQELIAKILTETKSEIGDLIVREKLRRSVIPISASERLDWALIGLKEFDQMINADKLRDAYSKLQEEDISFWLDYFLQTPPTLLAIGDI